MVHDVQDQYCLNNDKCELIYGKSWVVSLDCCAMNFALLERPNWQ
jgi:hypothetical protein